MKKTKAAQYVVTSIGVLCCIFMILHVFLTGEIAIWNFPASIPPILFLIIPTIILILELIKKERSRLGIIVSMVAIVLGGSQADFNIIHRRGVEQLGDTYQKIKVFDWNTFYWTQDKKQEEFYKFLKEQDADIYILQEYLNYYGPHRLPPSGVKKSDYFPLTNAVPNFPRDCIKINEVDRIKLEFPKYHIAIENQYVILSKFPIENIYLDQSDQFTVVDINVNGTYFRVFNVHMLLHIEPSNPFLPAFYEALDRRYKAREIGFNNLINFIEHSKQPYIIAGDFNSTTAMGVMDDLQKKHVDLYDYLPNIVPCTFNYKELKLWRLDYAFIKKNNPNIEVIKCSKLENNNLSDHDPFLVEVGLKKQHSR